MNVDEFKALTKGKEATIFGAHPGNGGFYGPYHESNISAWDVAEGTIGVSAGNYTWPAIEKWMIVSAFTLVGFYETPAFPGQPGCITICLTKKRD